MTPLGDGPPEVSGGPPLILPGGDPPATSPLHRDGVHQAVVPVDVALAARHGVNSVLESGHLDGPRAALGSRVAVHRAPNDTVLQQGVSIVGEGGGGV